MRRHTGVCHKTGASELGYGRAGDTEVWGAARRVTSPHPQALLLPVSARGSDKDPTVDDVSYLAGFPLLCGGKRDHHRVGTHRVNGYSGKEAQ